MGTIEEKYFYDLQKRFILKKGEFLLKKGEVNRRLFLLESGKMEGFDPEDEGAAFEVVTGEIVGLNSFFTPASVVQMSVVATEDSIVRYFQKDNLETDDEEGCQIACDFMPLVMQLLIQRQNQIQDANRERVRVLKEMQEVERLASLGQLSAVVAHELNNAITVIGRGSDLVSRQVTRHVRFSDLELDMLKLGMEKGRVVSSAEARKKARALRENSSCSEEQLRDFARTGAGEILAKESRETAQNAFEMWNLGATLHDLKLASRQAEHVISSMRSLASTSLVRLPGCDINESVKKAVYLLSNPLKNVDLKLALGKVPTISANSGELVQIWTNVIKNAIDAMEHRPKAQSRLTISSLAVGGFVDVVIRDSGPGIPPEIMDRIFKPHMTTKKEGPEFGLGLGLTIVQKIIQRYSGELSVKSSGEGAEFTIKLPIGEKS